MPISQQNINEAIAKSYIDGIAHRREALAKADAVWEEARTTGAKTAVEKFLPDCTCIWDEQGDALRLMVYGRYPAPHGLRVSNLACEAAIMEA